MSRRIALFVMAMLGATPAVAEVIQVPGDYAAIAPAVNAAASGDTVLVAPGIYTGNDNKNINFAGKSIALIAPGGFESTQINCENSGQAISIPAGGDARTLVKGFTFHSANSGVNGGAVNIYGTPATIEACRFFLGNTSLNGGALSVGYSTGLVTVKDCHFDHNAAYFRGGAVMADRAVALFTGCVFEQNIAQNMGGGAIFVNYGSVEVDQCTFYANWTNAEGNAINNAGATTVNRSLFLLANQGQGIQFYNSETAAITWCDFYGPLEAGLAARIGTDGNFDEEPMLCNGTYPFEVSVYSPCLAFECGQVGAGGGGCDFLPPGAPFLTEVSDVGNDQGRQVRLVWNASPEDGSAFTVITGYAVFRKQGPYKRGGGGDKMVPPGNWDYLTTVPAFGQPTYRCVVPTLCDSTVAEGMGLSTFFLRAMTPDPLEFFDSPPCSGYSLDNLAPMVPQNLVLAGTLLGWDPAADEDFGYFTVYGSSSQVLDASAAVVGRTTGTSFAVGGSPHPYYHLTATDFAGNEGPAATTGGVSDVPGAASPHDLHAAVPNPFNPSTRISFNLAEAGHARLSIYDAAGRLVAILVDEHLGAGLHQAMWDGRDSAGRSAAAGVYMYRMEIGTYAQSRGMVLIK